jgi:hypothetical protein
VTPNNAQNTASYLAKKERRAEERRAAAALAPLQPKRATPKAKASIPLAKKAKPKKAKPQPKSTPKATPTPKPKKTKPGRPLPGRSKKRAKE